MASNRDAILREQIDAIAAQATEGDEQYDGCKWRALRSSNVGEFSFVEAESKPATAYERHIFVVRCNDDGNTPTLLGEYVGDGNEWSLIASYADAPSGWRELFPAEQFTVRLADVAPDKRTQLVHEGFPDRFEKFLCEIICSYGFSGGDGDHDDDYETVKKKLSWEIVNCVHVRKYTYLHIDSGHIYPPFVLVIQFKKSGEPWLLGYYEQSGFQRRWKLRRSKTDDREWEQSFPEEQLGKVGTDYVLAIFAPLIFIAPFFLVFLGWLWWFSDFSTLASIVLTALPPIVAVVLSLLQIRDGDELSGSAPPEILEWERRKDPRTRRRITLGLGLGAVFIIALIGTFLAFVLSGQKEMLASPPIMAFLIACPFGFVISIFSTVSWALFYRCPQCKNKICREQNSYGRNYGGSIISLRYFCQRCGIEWRICWPANQSALDDVENDS